MNVLRVTKRFHFEMAHALYAYEGLCENIHGHSYNLEITVKGKVTDEPGHPGDGMVIDFQELKMIVRSFITDRLDHTLMINNATPDDIKESLKKSSGRILFVDFQPTTENLVVYIARILSCRLPSGISLYCIRLFETVTSYAEWFAADNGEME